MSVGAEIIVYAARYALGRRTYAPVAVEKAVAANLPLFARRSVLREALIRNIERAPDLGDKCDQQAWVRTLERLRSCRDGCNKETE